MSWSVLDARGRRKYLTASERLAFINAAAQLSPSSASTFCLTIALTGVRISEALGLTRDRIDVETCTVIIETLKRRRRGVFRSIPVPRELIAMLCQAGGTIDARIWPVSRTTGWKWIKRAMSDARIDPNISKPRALRHAFAVEAVRQRVALSLVKKWLGHARIETTAIYADPVGDEERALASLTWQAWRTGTGPAIESDAP